MLPFHPGLGNLHGFCVRTRGSPGLQESVTLYHRDCVAADHEGELLLQGGIIVMIVLGNFASGTMTVYFVGLSMAASER